MAKAATLAAATLTVVVVCGGGRVSNHTSAVTTTPEATLNSPTAEAAPTASPALSATEPSRARFRGEGGHGAIATPSDASTSASTIAAVPTNLTFSGGLSGNLRQALNLHVDTQSDPGSAQGFHQPTWTRCAYYSVEQPASSGHYDSYLEADLVGTVDQGQIALVLAIDTTLNHVPGSITFNSLSSISLWLYGPNGHSWYATKGMPDSQLTVNPDLHSGSMVAAILDMPWGGESHMVHVSGDWRCG